MIIINYFLNKKQFRITKTVGLQRINEEYQETDAKKQIEEFLKTVPIIERMNEIRKELSEKHREETQGRLDRGELKPEV
jgi:hypothetical protein